MVRENDCYDNRGIGLCHSMVTRRVEQGPTMAKANAPVIVTVVLSDRRSVQDNEQGSKDPSSRLTFYRLFDRSLHVRTSY